MRNDMIAYYDDTMVRVSDVKIDDKLPCWKQSYIKLMCNLQ